MASRRDSPPPLPPNWDSRYILNNITAPTSYGTTGMMQCPGARKLRLDVFNAAIFYQIGIGYPSPTWGQERFMAPARAQFLFTFDAIRVRRANAADTPQVTIEAIP